MKGNFRCALRKSDSFEEIKLCDSSGENQYPEYKVFKVLTAEEVLSKLLIESVTCIFIQNFNTIMPYLLCAYISMLSASSEE